MNFGIAFSVSGTQETINVVGFSFDDVADFALKIAADPTTEPNSVIVTKAS